jgi:hypothetical protein
VNFEFRKRLESEHQLGDSFDASVILFDDVVEVFVLAHQDVNTGVSLDAFNGRCIGTALVYGDFSGTPCRLMARSKKRLAAALSRLAVRRKSTVSPARSNAQ